MKEIMDGNIACSRAAYLFSEVATIYPITPSSTMASNVDLMRNKDYYNLFHDKVEVSELQSEAGASGAMHGALLAGSLATTFTASQGLLLMIPNMYKIAGEGLPGVIHVASRTVATHALSIFGDHSDIYATRATGFCMLASHSPESAYHMSIVSHLSAIKGSLPFLHFFDGFRTSHELNVVELLKESDILQLIDKEALKNFQNQALNLNRKIQRGMSETEDIYFQSIEARSSLYEKMPDIVNNYMEKINELANTNYKPFVFHGPSDAELLIIAMGSVTDTIRLVVKDLQKKGLKVGMIEVHLYRPFSKKYLEKVLPKTVKKIAVLDRTKESGSIGEPLYLDVVAALKDKDIQIVGGRYGISSKNTPPSDVYAVYKMLEENPKNNFTIGIIDDINHTSLPKVDYKLELNTYEMKIYGFGSDGMVSASKDLLHILGKQNYVQGYFEYDSKKSGGVTVSHLRIGKEKITSPYYVTDASLIVVTKEEYFEKYKILENIKENGILLINTAKENILEKLSLEDLEIIEQKKIKLYQIDADAIASKNHLPGKISKIMEAVILKILGVENIKEILSKAILEKFRTKGEEIVKNNQLAVEEALENIKKGMLIKKEKIRDIKSECTSIFEKMEKRLGNEIKVSDVYDLRTGIFPGELSKKEKRKTSKIVSKWKKENCIECGMCSAICPHAVIRPFLVKEDTGKKATGTEGYYYLISISESDCTGCGLCVEICPGKNGEKALYLENYQEEKKEENYFENYENPQIFPKFTIKGSQLIKPKFEFPGACAGCGETAYIKLLTQLYGEEIVIANATGCSSIYGGSAPSTPYSIPWANSLFEDNAEFAYGLNLSYKSKRKRIKFIIEESMNLVNENVKRLYNELLESFNNYEKTSKIKEELEKEEIPNELKELIEYIPSRTVIAIGGDGWAYDIGFGGLDHVLSTNENIKVLVLDTEVYSNTGGQMSKSSRVGAIAEFADQGKRNTKKDLFKIAMSYPNCYVASISLGANIMQSIKVMKEAMEHVGPSLIIAYSTCVEQGIKGGMSCSIKEQKLAVDVGYTLLMRYKPEEEKLYLDSKTPNFEDYDHFLENEVRYKALKIKSEKLAQKLLEENKQNAIKRFKYYEKISKGD